MTNKLEFRFIDNAQIQGTENGLTVSGYVNKTNQWSQTLGVRKKFVERILPNTFRKALQNSKEIDFLAEHDKSKILATTRNGSLELREDEQGLFMSATISDTSWGRDYHTLIKDGIIQNMSFGMQVLKDSWKQLADGTYERSISDIYLSEVSAVRNPAYAQSTISARSIEIVEEPTITLNEEKNNMNEQFKNKLDSWDKPKVRDVPIAKETEERAFEQFLRRQDGDELRAMTAFGAGSGALMVPTHLHAQLIEKVNQKAPIFARTRNVTPINGYAEVLRELTIGTASFIGEMQNITASDLTLDKVRLEAKRITTGLELSENLINDSGVDIVAYTNNFLSRSYANTVEDSILFGDKTKGQFEGILVDSADNKITQTTISSLANLTDDNLVDFYLSVNPAYHNDSCFIMSPKAWNRITKLKTLDGQFHVIRDVSNNIHRSLFGFPVLVHEAMDNPTLNPNNKLIVFGNLFSGYATMTRKGTRLRRVAGDTTQALRGSELFILDGFSDGKILQYDALKVMKFTTV